MEIQTKNLKLVLPTLEQVRAMIDAMPPEQKAEVSDDWLAQLDNATSADPWIHGFSLMHRNTNVVVGNAGFKGPPTDDGVVEIAYAIDPEHEGKGYATEAAEALTAYAFGTGKVNRVRAHTLPESNASTRVLTKCGFQCFGEVIDPEDGPVWRWEKHNEA